VSRPSAPTRSGRAPCRDLRHRPRFGIPRAAALPRPRGSSAIDRSVFRPSRSCSTPSRSSFVAGSQRAGRVSGSGRDALSCFGRYENVRPALCCGNQTLRRANA
jgi:hypothetical protein